MRVRLDDQADSFLATADPFFRADPFSANVVAVVAARVAAGAPVGGPDRLWVTVEDGDQNVLGVAMHTPPHPLFVSRMPRDAAGLLADELADTGRQLSGVNGACESTTAFADAWRSRTGQGSEVVTAMRMYRLTQLVSPRDVPGRTARATASEVELVAAWSAAFHDEAQPHVPTQDWHELAARRIAAAEVHLWYDEEAPVGFAAVSPPAAGVARVGPVYTPSVRRRRGYGAAVTAAATAATSAEHVVLYTDLANPTSNSIYQAIGYRPDHDAEERVFHPAPQQA